jgi:hypothetical protein
LQRIVVTNAYPLTSRLLCSRVCRIGSGERVGAEFRLVRMDALARVPGP